MSAVLLAEILGFKVSGLLPVANLTRDLPLARSRHHATNAVHSNGVPARPILARERRRVANH
jgi:hypothetical protein